MLGYPICLAQCPTLTVGLLFTCREEIEFSMLIRQTCVSLLLTFCRHQGAELDIDGLRLDGRDAIGDVIDHLDKRYYR